MNDFETVPVGTLARLEEMREAASRLTFPPINLWSAPAEPDLEDTMSTKYKHSHEVPTAVLAKRLGELADVVGKPGEERDRELTLRIPAELDRDADLVLCEAGQRLVALEAERDAVWETLIKVADMLNIDPEAARKIPGKPSEVYASHIARRDALKQAEGAALVAERALTRIQWYALGGTESEKMANHATLIASELRQQAEENDYE